MKKPTKSGPNDSDSIFPKRNALENTVLIITLLIALGAVGLLSAATTLNVGDISIASVNSDSPDGFTFVLLKDVDSSTVIKFTDNSFKGSGSATAANNIRGTENVVVWTSDSALSAGTVISIVNPSGNTTTVTGGGTATGALSGISASGDQVFAYQGTGAGSNITGSSVTETFSGSILYGANFANSGWLTSGADSAPSSYLPSQLSVADASIALGNSTDYAYTAARTGLTTSVYRAALANGDNWTGYAANQTQSTTNFAINATANLYWDANGKTAGTGGTGTWDMTTQSRFVNSSNDTYIHWVNSTASNDHTAVFGGTAGTVSVAAGGVTASGLQFTIDGYTVQNNTITLAGTVPGIDVGTGVTATISSVVAGSNGLTKTGGGPLRMLGNNVYSGPTTVTAGTFLLNGDNSAATGDVSVAATATLGGTGTVGGATTVSGTLAPGDPSTNGGVGTVTFKKATAFTPGSKLVFTLVNPASHDKVVNTNSDSLTFDADLLVRLDVTAYAASAALGDVFDLIDWTGTVIPNGFDPNLDIDLIGGPLSNGLGFSFTSFLSNGSVVVVPEPSRAILLGASLALLGLRRKRSKVAAEA